MSQKCTKMERQFGYCWSQPTALANGTVNGEPAEKLGFADTPNTLLLLPAATLEDADAASIAPDRRTIRIEGGRPHHALWKHYDADFSTLAPRLHRITGLAEADIDQNGTMDLVVRYLNTGDPTPQYAQWLNQNHETPAPVSFGITFAGFSTATGRTSPIHYQQGETPAVTTPLGNAVYLFPIHALPNTIKSATLWATSATIFVGLPQGRYRWNNGPLTDLPADGVITVSGDQGGNLFHTPISLTRGTSPRLDLFDQSGVPLGKITLLPPDHVRKIPQHTPSGIAVLHFTGAPNTPTCLLSADTLASVDQGTMDIARIWGDTLAREGNRLTIITYRPKLYTNGTVGDPQLSSGTIILGEHPSDAHYRDTTRHELSHNVQGLLEAAGHADILGKSWTTINQRIPRAVDFFSERRMHNNPAFGGHPQDNAHELFASLTNALTMSPTLWEKNLQRMEDRMKHPTERAIFRAGIRTILIDYRAALAKRMGAEHANHVMQKFFDVMEKTGTRHSRTTATLPPA